MSHGCWYCGNYCSLPLQLITANTILAHGRSSSFQNGLRLMGRVGMFACRGRCWSIGWHALSSVELECLRDVCSLLVATIFTLLTPISLRQIMCQLSSVHQLRSKPLSQMFQLHQERLAARFGLFAFQSSALFQVLRFKLHAFLLNVQKPASFPPRVQLRTNVAGRLCLQTLIDSCHPWGSARLIQMQH